MKKAFSIYWGAVVILLPLFLKIGKQIPPRYSKDLFFAFCVVLSVVLFGFTKGKLSLLLISSFFIILGFFNQYDFTSVNVQYQYVLMCSGIVLLNQISSQKVDTSVLAKFLAAGCVIQCIFVYFSHIQIDLYKNLISLFYNVKVINNATGLIKKSVSEGIGTLGNPNAAGAYIASTVPFVFCLKNKIFIPFCIGGLLLSISSMPVLSCIVGICFWVWTKKLNKRYTLQLLLLAIFCAMALFYTSNSGGYFSAGTRLTAWKSVFDLPFEWFILGKGNGFVYDFWKLFSYGSERFRQLHNEYLELYVGFGLIGLCAVMAFFKKEYRNILEAPLAYQVALVVCVTNSFGFFNLHLSSTATVFIIALGVCIKGDTCLENGTTRL